jgi:2-haloacid dehalogenase
MLDFGRFEAITFDCYGTLVDWEQGLADALGAICARHGLRPGREELLAYFAAVEAPIQAGPFLPYREVLRGATRQVAARLGFVPDEADLGALAASLPDWPPFPDTVTALRRLGTRYRLGVVSNIDDDLFAGTAARLGVKFTWLVTARQAGSYKPSRNNFHRALERIGLPWDRVLHAAQSLFHDVAPARSLGLATVWVNRRAGRAGGATPPSSARPHLEVPDLRTLAQLAVPD